MRTVRRLLLSRGLATGVMFAIVALFALSSIVPDVEQLQPAARPQAALRKPLLFWIGQHLRPRDVVTSPLFMIFPAYLLVAISTCTVHRIGVHRRRLDRGRAGLERFRTERRFTLPARADAGAVLAERLREARYDVAAASDRSVHGRRGSIGFWGSIAFHIGLLGILGGAVVSSLTALHGEIVLTEGFPVPFTRESMLYLSGAGNLPDLGGASLSIRDFLADYSKRGDPVDFSVRLGVVRDGRRIAEELVRVNRAFHYAGLQLTLHRYGFAPALEARDPSGRIVLDAVSVMQLLPPGKQDSVPLDGGGELRVRLYPDFTFRDGKPATQSLQPIRPAIEYAWIDRGGGTRAAGIVEVGRTASIDGYQVSFPSVSYWGALLVARDRGIWLFALGAALGVLGLALRLLFPDQSVRLSWEPREDAMAVTMTASTRFFPALHEEQVDRLAQHVLDTVA